jgi:hypothetical protein
MATPETPSLVDCSKCDMPLVVFPLSLFPRMADWDGNRAGQTAGGRQRSRGRPRGHVHRRGQERHLRLPGV